MTLQASPVTLTGTQGAALAARMASRDQLDYFLKPAVVAGVGLGLSRYEYSGSTNLFNAGASVPVLGMSVSPNVAVFAGNYLSSMLASGLSMHLAPAISSGSYGGVIASLIEPALQGGSQVLLWGMLAGAPSLAELGSTSLFVTGGISELVGSYVYERIVAPLFA